MNEKRKITPDRKLYGETLARLTEEKQMTTLIAVRMGCEMGMSRLEIVNAKISDIDRINLRGLWIEVAKRVRRGNKKVDGKKVAKFEMRQREVPINANLYQLLIAYVDRKQQYILQREKGAITTAFIPRYINKLYDDNMVPWATHHSRHFFKSQVWSHMQKKSQVDAGLMKEFLGHQKSTTESYGEYSWDYKCEVLDEVFS